MKNMERENFEESLRNALEKAGIAPSDKVWTNIELDLEKEKGGNLRKRLLFYQILAAASVVFAMAIGGVGLYYNLNPGQPATNNNNVALQTSPSSDIGSSAEGISREETDLSSASETETSQGGFPSAENTASPQEKNPTPGNVASAENHGVPIRTNRATAPVPENKNSIDGRTEHESRSVALSNTEEVYPPLPVALDDRHLPALYTPGRVQVTIPSKQETVDPVVAMMAQLEQREREIQAEEKNKKDKGSADENLWTSIGFAAGSFNTMQSSTSSPSPMIASLAAPIVDQETKGTGYSYSMGVNLGTKISERWVIQGGVNYLTHASQYTANNVVVSSGTYQQQRFKPATTNELLNASEMDLSNKIVYSAPYNVNNSMRYLSIPMQAGYLLINKTFGLQLNAGVATDLFLQNTVSADSDDLDKTTQPGGSDSPYRTVNLSGLLGTEVSYRFSEHYRIALNPGIRYPFSTIYKSELGVQSTPLTFDVGLRFRYIFH